MRGHHHQRVRNTENEEENPEENVEVIGNSDIEGSVTCPECGVSGPGIITSEIPLLVYIAVLVMIVVIGKWAFLIAPFLFLLVNAQIRTCTSCGTVIEQKIQFSFKAVNESVYTIKFSGDLVIVISKKYAMVIGSVLLLIFFSVFTYEEFFASSSTDGRQRSNIRCEQIC